MSTMHAYSSVCIYTFPKCAPEPSSNYNDMKRYTYYLFFCNLNTKIEHVEDL